jgi:3-hydroxybutyrate dehydrogenase
MLKGRRAIVTGSTTGIGQGIANAIAAAGCAVMLNGFGEAAEIEAQRAEMIRRYGVEVLYNGADLAKPEDCEQLVRDTEKRLGGVDILVNNAGIQHIAPIEDFPIERWQAVIAVNLSSFFYTMRAALPCMKARNWGRLINISSAHGLIASTNKCAYIAAKHGILGLTKAVALENAKTGVTCNAICPGWVLTELVKKQIALRAQTQGISYEQAQQNLIATEPTGRFSTPEEMGALAVFLCGEHAGNITGASFCSDGGYTAQ